VIRLLGGNSYLVATESKLQKWDQRRGPREGVLPSEYLPSAHSDEKNERFQPGRLADCRFE
jgi:hypothetical protein